MSREPSILTYSWSVSTLLLALVISITFACGGGDDLVPDATSAPTDGQGGDDGGGDGGGNGEGAPEETVSVNETFWHGGFMVELGDATYAVAESDFLGVAQYVLTIEALFTNEGEDEAFFQSSMTVVTPDNDYSSGFQDVPRVPAELSSRGELTFRVDEDFAFDDAYLRVGEGGEHLAQVPLGPGGGELIDLAPVDAGVTGAISMELIDLSITSAEIRTDVPVRHETIDDDQLALTVNLDAVSRRQGNWTVFAAEFVLTLPDGSSVAVDGSNLGNLPGAAEGLTTSDLYVRFLVDNPATGDYTLTFRPASGWVGEGEPEGTLEFALE